MPNCCRHFPFTQKRLFSSISRINVNEYSRFISLYHALIQIKINCCCQLIAEPRCFKDWFIAKYNFRPIRCWRYCSSIIAFLLRTIKIACLVLESTPPSCTAVMGKPLPGIRTRGRIYIEMSSLCHLLHTPTLYCLCYPLIYLPLSLLLTFLLPSYLLASFSCPLIYLPLSLALLFTCLFFLPSYLLASFSCPLIYLPLSLALLFTCLFLLPSLFTCLFHLPSYLLASFSCPLIYFPLSLLFTCLFLLPSYLLASFSCPLIYLPLSLALLFTCLFLLPSYLLASFSCPLIYLPLSLALFVTLFFLFLLFVLSSTLFVACFSVALVVSFSLLPSPFNNCTVLCSYFIFPFCQFLRWLYVESFWLQADNAVRLLARELQWLVPVVCNRVTLFFAPLRKVPSKYDQTCTK